MSWVVGKGSVRRQSSSPSKGRRAGRSLSTLQGYALVLLGMLVAACTVLGLLLGGPLGSLAGLRGERSAADDEAPGWVVITATPGGAPPGGPLEATIAAQAAAAQPTPAPTADASSLFVETYGNVGAAALPVMGAGVDQLYADRYRQLEQLIAVRHDPYLRLVVRPIGSPDLEINFGGNLYQNAASTFKAPVLLYAIFRDPRIALTGWEEGVARDAYRMVVGSHNSATGSVLVKASGVDANTHALDHFNDFLHDIVGLPSTVGLTQWNYGPTTGMVSQHVLAADPTYDPDEVSANPITLDALVDFFTFLESPGWVEGAISRAQVTPGYPVNDDYASPEVYRQGVLAAVDAARELMTVPDPEIPTELELSLARVQAQNPDLDIDLYGKNGSLRPGDWPEGRWLVIEGAVVTVTQGALSQRCVVAYAASHFDNAEMLDEALSYCVALARQATGAGG